MKKYFELNKKITLYGGFMDKKYTGMNDKNGRKIFDGDIYHMGDPNIKYIVNFSDKHNEWVGKQLTNNSTAGLKHWLDRIEVVEK